MLTKKQIDDSEISSIESRVCNLAIIYQVRMKGLEPSLLSELEPKSSASANSATSASVFYTSIENLLWEGEMGKVNTSVVST